VTVILIGGPMAVDDGTTMDSRQAMSGDPRSQATHASLATSLLWWLSASSLVGPILESAGLTAFALVIGVRSVQEVLPDGTVKRTRLASFLTGGTTRVELIRTGIGQQLPEGYEKAGEMRAWNDDVYGTVGVKRTSQGSRWVFLDGNEYYLNLAGRAIGPTVIVDTSLSLIGGTLSAHAFESLESRRLFDDETVLVLPHTYRTGALMERYVEWVQAGRPKDHEPYVAAPTEWDPVAPPDPIRYTCPVPVRAQFEVTGLVQDGAWRDPSDLEAARSLLQARYDLKIGIWDLVGNPTLRRTLLATLPIREAPGETVEVPPGAAARARRRVAKKMDDRAAEKAALRSIYELLAPMREVGWEEVTPGGNLFLPFTEPFHRWPEDEPFPLVRLELVISKRHCAVNAFTILYNQVSLGSYVNSRRATLEEIAAPEVCTLGGSGSGRAELWREAGGWGDTVDWAARGTAIAGRSPRWAEIFRDLCDECRAILEGRSGSGND